MFKLSMHMNATKHTVLQALRTTAAIGLAMMWSGLGLAQGLPAKEATKLEILIEASAKVNQDSQGRGVPIQVKVFELKEVSAFESADFFGLMQDEKTTLAAEMTNKYEYVLRPGQKALIERKSHTETTAIGIVAGYRELASSEWRALVPLTEAPEAAWYRMVLPANKLKFKVMLEDNGIKIIENQ